MRGVIQRWKARVRDRVRAWIFGEEIQIIGNLKYQVKNLGDVMAQSIHHEASILAALARLEAQLGIHQSSTTALRDSEERRFRDLLAVVARIEASQNRLFDAVEPVVNARRRPVPFVPEWDHVQAEALREVEESQT
jgi:hypothetical protein